MMNNTTLVLLGINTLLFIIFSLVTFSVKNVLDNLKETDKEVKYNCNTKCKDFETRIRSIELQLARMEKLVLRENDRLDIRTGFVKLQAQIDALQDTLEDLRGNTRG